MRTFSRHAAVIGALLALSMPVFPADDLRVEIHAGDNQTAAPGESVEIAPAVLVTDGDGLPVQDETVNFSILSGGGLIFGASPTSDADGVAEIGGWTLGTQPGVKELQASLSGAEGSPLVFTAIAEAETDLAVDLTVEDPVMAGEPFLYELLVFNDGPYGAEGVEVEMTFDDKIEPSSISWTCTDGGGAAKCSESGSGSLSDSADVPADGWVLYTVSAQIPIQLTSGTVTSSAEIEPPDGILLSSTEDGHSSVAAEIEANPKPIFRDRFEAGDE